MDKFYKEYAKGAHGVDIGEEKSVITRNRKRAMAKPSYNKWDIVMAEFGQEYDCCLIRDYRPAIVYSSDDYNEKSPIVHLIPLTRSFKGVDRNYHVFLDKDDCFGYEASGIALIEQLRPLDRKCVKRKVGEIYNLRAIRKIESAVADFFELLVI
jgi:mRNA-degrading endonuclease toxin of MazEF toxin-antitoxin module